ncbi:unnamed protein product [Protopolystoma xenopodis]|uniref:Uncharacterized protein n=1 Tax=Protopolystoma xenopodis TaxID=117903 RepID=A0A448WMB3_9PLAT|nr:unnamed protein product [Protopolystoma xenopodis]
MVGSWSSETQVNSPPSRVDCRFTPPRQAVRTDRPVRSVQTVRPAPAASSCCSFVAMATTASGRGLAARLVWCSLF